MGALTRGLLALKSDEPRDVYERFLQLLGGMRQSKAGPSVDLAATFRVSAAFACIQHIARGVAGVPFKLHQDYVENNMPRKRVARDHPLYDVLTVKPNKWQTSFEFRETLAIHACMGNAYVFINRYRGVVSEMFLLNPSRVRAEQADDWTITYKVRGKDGVEREIPASDIWHVRGPSWDGFLGLDTLNMAKEALGLSIALEESHAGLHKNGVRTTGLYSVDTNLNDKQHNDLVQWIKDFARAEPGTPMVLDKKAQYHPMSMTGVDAQHKETRDHQIEEVCRFFGVLPVCIGYSGGKASTYASVEAMFAADKEMTKGPWYTRIQESADANLLTADERKAGYYWKFNSNGLMFAVAKDRGEYISRALGSGGSPAWITQDEARAFDELDPMGGTAAVLPVATNVPKTQPNQG